MIRSFFSDKITMRFLLIIFWLVNFSLNGMTQVHPVNTFDRTTEPKLFNQIYYNDYYDYKEIESITSIHSRRSDNFSLDTTFISYYDDEGNIKKRISYRGNMPDQLTEYFYDVKTNLLKTESTIKHNKSYTLYNYDSLQQLIQLTGYRIDLRKKPLDTTQLYVQSFKYVDSKLIEFQSNKVGKKTEQFFYDENGNIDYRLGGYLAYKYQYDSNGNLIEVREYVSEIQPNQLKDIRKYIYDEDGKLKMDSTLVLKNFKSGSYYSSTYTYDEHNDLKLIQNRFEDDYSQIEIFYEKDQLKEVRVNGNAVSAYFRFPYFSHYGEGTYEVVEKFDYDDRGNKILKKRWVNGELEYEMKFEIKYKAKN